MNDHETRADTGADDKPPSRLRLPLATMDDVRRELARLYREGKSGRRDVADVSRLANVLQILSRVIEGSTLEARVEALEAAETRQGGAQSIGGTRTWQAH